MRREIMSQNDPRDLHEWAQHLESGNQDDPTLALAVQLSNIPVERVVPPATFKAELRKQLLMQSMPTKTPLMHRPLMRRMTAVGAACLVIFALILVRSQPVSAADILARSTPLSQAQFQSYTGTALIEAAKYDNLHGNTWMGTAH